MYDILSFDTEFGYILQELQIIVERKRFLESCSNDSQQIEDLCFRGAPIEDLCLDFTLPGYPDYVLKEGEENTVVSDLTILVSGVLTGLAFTPNVVIDYSYCFNFL